MLADYQANNPLFGRTRHGLLVSRKPTRAAQSGRHGHDPVWVGVSVQATAGGRCTELVMGPVAVRRLPMRVNLSGRGTLTGRARVPARREGVLEANGVFSRLIEEGSGLREQRIARTRSLPSLVRRPDRRTISDRNESQVIYGTGHWVPVYERSPRLKLRSPMSEKSTCYFGFESLG